MQTQYNDNRITLRLPATWLATLKELGRPGRGRNGGVSRVIKRYLARGLQADGFKIEIPPELAGEGVGDGKPSQAA